MIWCHIFNNILIQRLYKYFDNGRKKSESVKNGKFWVSTRKLFARVIWPQKIHWWQNFYSRWRSLRVIVNLKFQKFRRGGMFWWHAIFSVNFFLSFFLHQCVYRDHTSRHFSIYQFLFCKSVPKMAAKLKFGQKSAIPPNVLAPFFL